MTERQLIELSELVEAYGDQRAKLSRDLLKDRPGGAAVARKQLEGIRHRLENDFGLVIF